MTKRELNPILKSYYDTFDVAIDNARPHWELAVRMYSLWRGVLPPEIDGTFSKVMINNAHSAVQDELPKKIENMFSQEDYVSLEANTVEAEAWVDPAQNWLRHQLKSVIKLFPSIIPCLQSNEIFGTGFREVGVRYERISDDKWSPRLISQNADFFHIVPMPGGGLINPVDRHQENALPGYFKVDWMTESKLKHLATLDGYNSDEIGRMLKSAPSDEGHTEQQFKDYSVVDGVDFGSKNSIRGRMNDIKGIEHSRRVVHWYQRGKYILIGEDKHVLYHEGPPPLPNDLFPLVKYVSTPDIENFYGIGTLEMVEDLLLALMLNFNLRMDRLAGAVNPPKWIRQDIFDNATDKSFEPAPYAQHLFPRNVVDIQKAIYYDRAPELDPQIFIEDTNLKAFIQEVQGLPNYSKGQGGSGTLANETATGIVSLIEQANGRLTMETLELEYGGLREECALLLVLADEHVTEMQDIRVSSSKDGFPWIEVDPDVISNDFSVQTHGTRDLSHRNASIQRALAVFPMLANDPYIQGHDVLRQEFLEMMNLFKSPEKIVGLPQQLAGPAAQQGQLPPPGGASSSLDISQQSRSTENRNTVEAETGATTPAGFGV